MHGAARRGGTAWPARPTAPLPHLLLLALLVASCRGEPEPLQRALLRELQVDGPSGAGEAGAATCPGAEGVVPAAEPREVARGNSQRQAVLTCEGVALRVALDPPAPSVLDLSLALGPGLERRPARLGEATATVELRRNGRYEVLLEAPVAVGPWAEHRIELAADGPAELVLRSSGATPVAWADLHLAAAGEAGDRSGDRPSLVLVSLDTVRADHLSLYGYERSTTPRLERLGEESLVFTRALSSSTWTLPATATLLTGLLPSQHGALHVTKRLGPEVATVAERLREAGYRTAALTDGGFAGFPFGFGQGFDRYDVTPGKAWHARAKDAAHTFGEAAAWVRRNRHRPFFLFLHTYEAHQPYLHREGFASPFLAPEDRAVEDLAVSVTPHDPERDPEKIARMVALYDGEIARADHYLGRFLDALAEEGLAGEVAVIVTSDHGEEFLEHGDLEHAWGKVFDPNVHVPLVVRPPAGRREAGARRIDVPVSGIDVAPTLLDLAGLSHDDLPGRSLLAVAEEAGEEPVRPSLVHGVPSFPNQTAERFRLDGAGPTLILDRPKVEDPTALLRYRPAAGDVTAWDRPAAPPMLRLAGLVAWAEAGALFARLPDDARRLAVPDGSRIHPRALWTGTRWVRVEREARAALDPGGPGLELAPEPPHLLAFDLAGGDGPWPTPWDLLLAPGAGADPEPYRLTAQRRPPWNPFTDPLPPAGAVLPTAPLRSAAAAHLDEETAKELRALGYLQ